MGVALILGVGLRAALGLTVYVTTRPWSGHPPQRHVMMNGGGGVLMSADADVGGRGDGVGGG
jgi:hypothetical protein